MSELLGSMGVSDLLGSMGVSDSPPSSWDMLACAVAALYLAASR